MLPPQRDVDSVEPPQHHPVEVDLDCRNVGGDAGVVRERCAQHEQAVAAAHMDRGDGDAGPAEHPARQGMVVGDEALRFERGDDRRVRCSATATISAPYPRAPFPQMMTGRSALARSATARSRSGSGGAMPLAATRPASGRAGGSARPFSSCTSSGKIRWATSCGSVPAGISTG